jgi:SulP family sulfate permease
MAKALEDTETREDPQLFSFDVPQGVEVFEVNGPLFFGATSRFAEIDRQLSVKPRVRILRFRDVPLIDSSGMRALRGFCDQCRQSGIHLIVTGLHVQPLNEMVKSNLYELIGPDNVFSGMKDALKRANEIIASSSPAAQRA